MNINAKIKLLEERILSLQKQMEEREKRIKEYYEKPKSKLNIFRKRD